jgi:trans-aconitate methyltransferase
MTHEFDGNKYAIASTHQKEWGAKLISGLHLKGNEHILDLGCGDGALTAQLADFVPQGKVIGIDSSRGMIEAALKHQKSNLSFAVKDINFLDYIDQFDVVFSNATLHWVKDHRLLLNNVLRSMKRDGIIRFNFAAEGNCIHFYKIIKRVMHLPNYETFFKEFIWPWYMPSILEYHALVNEFPFSEVKVWGENADRYFPDAEAMSKWIDQPSIVPFLECVEESQKHTFRNTVVDLMIKETLQPDGTCFETFRRINVLARK